jgi:hypothetical protein
MLVQIVPAQSAAHKGPPKPPRALGLLQLAPNGKAHLIPITILYDGEFYDASAYKAAPVPMALESGTVYEALRTGVSQGLFTVSTALQANNTWIGDGTWQSASALAAATAKKKAVPSKPPAEPVQGPPVLRRRADAEKAKAPEPEPTPPPAPAAPASTNPAPASTASTPPPAPAGSAPAPAAPPPVSTAEEEDPDRPVLKRGAPSPAEKKKLTASKATPAKGDAHTATSSAASSAASSVPPPTSAASSTMQLIPAISDSDGPDPRPYAYDTKPDEEQKLRKTMLSLAADEVRARATQLAAGPVGSAPASPSSSVTGSSKSGSSKSSSSKSGARAKLPQPTFEETQLRIFDLSNSNEPVLVLTTKARMPARPNASGANAQSGDLQYIVTLVGREDIYGEVHKAFSSITDTQHLDVLPRMELIDAVDADGDGHGELLFRQISDAGKAFVLYRVIGDRLWPLFEETPQ